MMYYTCKDYCPPGWRSWLARQSHNLKVVSSSLTEGILSLPKPEFSASVLVLHGPKRTFDHDIFKAKIEQF